MGSVNWLDRDRQERDVMQLVERTVPELKRIARNEHATITGLSRKRDIAESIAYQRQYREWMGDKR